MGKQRNSGDKSNSNSSSEQNNNKGSQVNIGDSKSKEGAESTRGLKTGTRPKK